MKLLERRTPELLTFLLLAAGMVSYGQAAAATTAAAPAVDWVMPALEKAGTVGVCLWIIWYFQKRTDANQAKLSDIAERSLVLQERTTETIRDFAHALRSMRCFAPTTEEREAREREVRERENRTRESLGERR